MSKNSRRLARKARKPVVEKISRPFWSMVEDESLALTQLHMGSTCLPVRWPQWCAPNPHKQEHATSAKMHEGNILAF